MEEARCQNNDWRPLECQYLSLSDDDLKKIGLTVVAEAASKSIVCAMVRSIEGLDEEEWKRLDAKPFKKLCYRLQRGTKGIDSELTNRLQHLENVRAQAHDLRHIVVHAIWGQDSEGGALSFDYRRQRLIQRSDIDAAMFGCSALKAAARSAAIRVAELVNEGVWTERPGRGQGMAIGTTKGWVNL